MERDIKLSTFNITIVGLGLMGGSLARALHGNNIRIMAVDPDSLSLEMALDQGVISSGTSELKTGFSGADVIILATPVKIILDILRDLPQLRPEGCLVMDLGSTKEEIGEAMSALPEKFEAIGGHPMCGREQSGFLASTSTLFDGQSFILCRNQRTSRRAEEIAVAIVETIHALPLFLEARIHDEIVALTSHLPYLLAALLTSRVAGEASTDERYWQISATGLRDVSRLAGSNPQMMTDILASNRRSILKQIQKFEIEIKHLLHAFEDDDLGAVSTWLQTAWQHHNSYAEHRWPKKGEV